MKVSEHTSKPLTAFMDNLDAWRLGEIALKAGDRSRTDVGDLIDRGLILRRLLAESGYALCKCDSVHVASTGV